MKAQWYKEDGLLRVFPARESTMLLDFNVDYMQSLEDCEEMLRLIGWRRRGPWKQCDWGYEVSLRKV